MSASWLAHIVYWMETLQAAGWGGWLLFICLYAGSSMFFLPGSLLTLGAGAIYGFWGGVFLVLVANGVGAFVSLLVTRYLLRDWAVKYFARYPKMRALQIAIEKEGWKIVCLTHLSPIMPFSVINYAYGLTNISIWEFLLATEVASFPATCIYVYVGTFLGNLAKLGSEVQLHRPLEWVLQGLGLIVTIVVTIYLARIATRALTKQLNPGEPS